LGAVLPDLAHEISASNWQNTSSSKIFQIESSSNLDNSILQCLEVIIEVEFLEVLTSKKNEETIDLIHKSAGAIRRPCRACLSTASISSRTLDSSGHGAAVWQTPGEVTIPHQIQDGFKMIST